MSDSGGFLDNLKSRLTDVINKITGGSSADPAPAAAPVPAAAPATEPTFRDNYLSFIPVDIWNSIIYYADIAIKIIIPLLFASIVANEMIIYKPSVRLFYFILTWILCFAFTSFRGIIVMYYVLRWAFNKYKKGEGASGGFFPTLYAVLPWSTDYETLRPLRYLTLDIGTTPMTEAFQNESFQKKLKNVYYLGEKMVDYFNVLESANPFRAYPEYEDNFKNVTKLLFEMHMPALEIDHKHKQYIIELRRSNEGNDEKEEKEIIEYIQMGEHSIPPPVEKKRPLKDRKQPLYMATYDKHTKSFTLKEDNDAFQKDAAKMKKKEEEKTMVEKREAEEKQREDASAALTAAAAARETKEAEAKAEAKAKAERNEEIVSNNNANVTTGLLANRNSFQNSQSNSSGVELTSLRNNPTRKSQVGVTSKSQSNSNEQLNRLGSGNNDL